MEALRVLRKGLNQSEVAGQLNVCHRSVGRWAKAYAEQGWHSLRKAGRAGRKPRLSGEGLKRLERGPPFGSCHFNRPQDRNHLAAKAACYCALAFLSASTIS